jgi:hypothetical protein
VDEIRLRERLVVAGVELLEQDAAALSLRVITRRVGVSHAAAVLSYPQLLAGRDCGDRTG